MVDEYGDMILVSVNYSGTGILHRWVNLYRSISQQVVSNVVQSDCVAVQLIISIYGTWH